jgi:hypothetical protein
VTPACRVAATPIRPARTPTTSSKAWSNLHPSSRRGGAFGRPFFLSGNAPPHRASIQPAFSRRSASRAHD